jgi:hypothetical protein
VARQVSLNTASVASAVMTLAEPPRPGYGGAGKCLLVVGWQKARPDPICGPDPICVCALTPSVRSLERRVGRHRVSSPGLKRWLCCQVKPRRGVLEQGCPTGATQFRRRLQQGDDPE